MIIEQATAESVVEFHCHGIGRADFSSFSACDLISINAAAFAEDAFVIVTAYLRPELVREFVALTKEYARLRADGLLGNVIGFALEGPLLASHGGTPASGVWLPSKGDWETLAACGTNGLRYVVLSPDFGVSGSAFEDHLTHNSPSLPWIVQTLVSGGVRPALGHFIRSLPEASAEAVEIAVDAASDLLGPATRNAIVTDHLFNDMPLNFRHVWRRPDQAPDRVEALARMKDVKWTPENATELLGPVPGALIRAALAHQLTLCLNFDGEHVDLEFCRRALELVGAENIVAMTDRTDAADLGGQPLHRESHGSLWYQADGVVAAGSQSVQRQVANLKLLGVSEDGIRQLTFRTAERVIHGFGD